MSGRMTPMCEHSGWTGQRKRETRTVKLIPPQDDPGAAFHELMMIEDEEEERRTAKPENLVEVAGYAG